MNNNPNSDFIKLALGHIDRNIEFKPIVTYDPDGDCIEFLISNKCFYAKRMDSLVTVYYSQETDEIVGSLIKGVSRYINKLHDTMPGFAVQISKGSTMLSHLFLIRMWLKDGEKIDTHIYEELQGAAERTNVRIPEETVKA